MAVRLCSLAVLVGVVLSLPSLVHAQGGADTRLVVRVIDGDTLELAGGERVRLIGVDTPETVHPTRGVERFGKEAATFTRRLAEGQRVQLEGDPGSASTDRYGRSLAYVFLPDGRLLNLEIVSQGYGFAYTKYPFTRMEEFRGAESEAREQRRGLWADVFPDREGAGGRTAGQARREPVAESSSCIPREECCKVCAKGRACGASCISASKTCRAGRGCACNREEVCR
jgi:endonuclease YncB( thermonuclease family)